MITLEKNGIKKKVSTGYSWKLLLVGFLYPLCRGDYKGFLRHFLYTSIAFPVFLLVTPFLYNKKYIKSLIEDGWKPFGRKDEDYLVVKFDYVKGL